MPDPLDPRPPWEVADDARRVVPDIPDRAPRAVASRARRPVTRDVPPPVLADLVPRVRDTCRALNYSRRTAKAYAGWIARYVRFHHGCDPRRLGERDISRYLTFLATRCDVSPATQNQSAAALMFL